MYNLKTSKYRIHRCKQFATGGLALPTTPTYPAYVRGSMLENHENPEVGLFLRSLSSSSLGAGQIVGLPRDTKPFGNNKGDRVDRIGKPADFQKKHQLLEKKPWDAWD